MARTAAQAPRSVVLAGTAFSQISDGPVVVDYRPGIPVSIARQAGTDFTHTIDIVSHDLSTTYPSGPYRLVLYKTTAGYANGLVTIEGAPAFCKTFTLRTHEIEPMGNRVLGIPVTGGQGGMDFLIGHELTDRLVARTGGVPFAQPCTGKLLTPWINDGFADYIGDQIGGQGYAFTPLLQQVDHVNVVAFDRASHTPIDLATQGWPTWRQGFNTPSVSRLEYAVADEMVRAVIARGGMPLFKRLVVADGAGKPLTPILGESPNQLAGQAWSGYQRWYAALHLPAAYFAPSVWLWQSGRAVDVGRVYAFGLKPGAHPQVIVDGVPAKGPVPAVGTGGLFFMSLPSGARSVTVDGLAAQAVSAPLAKRLMAGLGQVAPGTPSPSSASQGGLRLVVTPRVSPAPNPLTIRISGLQAGQPVTLTVTSVDSRAFSWKSVSRYTAGPSGTVNPASTPSTGPSYTGVDAMGPIDFMTSTSTSEPLYFWDGGVPMLFQFTATSGTRAASLTVERSLGASVRASSETVAQEGFAGEYWQPTTPSREPHAAVLLLGSSAGGTGYALMAGTLAAQGYPTLNISYLRGPGLPASLKNIPLEYFAKALRWLAGRPGVNGRRLWVDGMSRGSEAALLLGVHYPNLVHGVIALVPSDAATCSFPGCTGPAWSFNGQAVPYAHHFNGPRASNPADLIPVGKIRGPVFLDCGGADQVWSSCANAHEIMAELAAAHDPYPHVLMVSQQGGHGSELDGPPYEPGLAAATWGTPWAGATLAANELARATQWPAFLAFLKN